MHALVIGLNYNNTITEHNIFVYLISFFKYNYLFLNLLSRQLQMRDCKEGSILEWNTEVSVHTVLVLHHAQWVFIYTRVN